MNEAGWSEVVAAVAAVGLAKEPEPRGRVAAMSLGFVDGDGLTEAGRGLMEDGILRSNDESIRASFAAAVRQQPQVREFLEGAWGQDLSRAQAEHILRYIHHAAREWKSADFTRLFETLNFAGLIAFNRKTGVIRNLVATPTTRLDPHGALISPSTPFRNRRVLAALVGGARQRLWWFDAHFPRAGLQFIYDECDFTTLRDVRILSCGRSEIGPATIDEYRRLRQELSARGVAVEWRTLLEREDFTNKHDRWLYADSALWNVPPFSAAMQNKFGSLLPDPTGVPVAEWWAAGVEIDKLP